MSAAQKQKEYREKRAQVNLTLLARKLSEPDSLLTPAEAAVYLKCTEQHLSNLRCKGEGPKYVQRTPRARVFYRPKDLKKFIEESTIDPNA